MMRNFGMTEILLILLVLMILFGAKRIPDLARSLGRSLSEFKRGRREGAEDDLDEDADNRDAPKKS